MDIINTIHCFVDAEITLEKRIAKVLYTEGVTGINNKIILKPKSKPGKVQQFMENHIKLVPYLDGKIKKLVLREYETLFKWQPPPDELAHFPSP